MNENRRNTTRDMIIIVILVIATQFPFLNKAFHIDDTAWIYEARQIQKCPYKPYDSLQNWYGSWQRSWEIHSNPPLLPYSIALVSGIFGESERALHISFILFSIIASVSMYYLSRQFTNMALAASLLLITTPAFLVMATGVMTDIQFLSLFLLSITLFLHGIRRKDFRFICIAGFAGGLASLTKYVGLTMLPLLLVYTVLARKKLIHFFLFSGIVLFIFFLWCIQNVLFYGGLHIIQTMSWLHLESFHLTEKALGTLGYLGSATIFPLIILLPLNENRVKFWLFLILAAVVGIVYPKFIPSACYTGKDALLLFIYLTLGVFLSFRTVPSITKVIVSLCKDGFKSSTEELHENAVDTFLFLWFWGILIFNILTEFSAVRFVLIQIPPLILILIRMARGIKVRKFVWWTGIVCNLILALMVSYGDYLYAESYRDFSATVRNKINNEGKVVFFSGHWGFQFYMEKEGFKCFSPKVDSPQKGDILVIPAIASYDMPIDISSKEQIENYLGRKVELIEMVEYNNWFPVRTMHGQVHAGFYSHGWGFLPFGFSRIYLEKFYIWKFI